MQVTVQPNGDDLLIFRPITGQFGTGMLAGLRNLPRVRAVELRRWDGELCVLVYPEVPVRKDFATALYVLAYGVARRLNADVILVRRSVRGAGGAVDDEDWLSWN